MIKIQIKKQDVVTNSAEFPSMEEAQAWLDKHEGMKTFGEKAIYAEQQVEISPEVRGPVQVLVTEAEFDEFGSEITPAIYTVDPDGVVSPAVYETQTVLVSAAQYEVEITDISAQKAQEAINNEALAYLASTDWMIVRQSETGIPCPQDILTARATARASIVR